MRVKIALRRNLLSINKIRFFVFAGVPAISITDQILRKTCWTPVLLKK